MEAWSARVPYDGVGEHLLGLASAEGVEVAAAAAVDGEADDGVGGEDAAEGGEERVAQGEEHVALEPDPAVPVPAAAPGLLVPRRLPRDGLERHGGAPVVVLIAAASGHDVEHDALGAAAEDGDGPEVRQGQLPRLRRRRERVGRHGHHTRTRGRRCRDWSEEDEVSEGWGTASFSLPRPPNAYFTAGLTSSGHRRPHLVVAVRVAQSLDLGTRVSLDWGFLSVEEGRPILHILKECRGFQQKCTKPGACP